MENKSRSFRAEVEYDDDGASMAGARCGTIRRAEIITIEAESADDFRRLLKETFTRDRYYSTIRRVGVVEEA